jgi:hypothetical protein
VSTQEVKGLLDTAANELQETWLSVGSMQDRYTDAGNEFSRLQTILDGEAQPLVRQASENYEKGVQLLRRILRVYNEKVSPGRQALRLEDLDSPEVAEALLSITRLRSNIDVMTDSALTHHFRNKIFEKLGNQITSMATSSGEIHGKIEAELVGDTAILPTMHSALAAAATALRTLHDQLDE